MRFSRVFLTMFLLAACTSCSVIHFKKQPHPILQKPQEWIFLSQHHDYLTNGVMWRTSTYFGHPNGKWFLGTHEIFGKLAVKLYCVRETVYINGKLEEVLLEHYVEIKKGKKWHTVKSEHVSFEKIWNGCSGKVIGIFVDMRDEKGKIIGELFKRDLTENFSCNSDNK